MARRTSLKRSVPGLFGVLRHFWPWIRRERAGIAGALTAMITAVLIRLAEPWPLKLVLDHIIPTERPEGLNTPAWIAGLSPTALVSLAALAVVAITASRAFFEYRQRVGLARIGNRVLRRVRNDVYLHAQGLSLAFHARSRTGDVIIRVTRDVSLLRDVVSTAVLPLLANVLILVGMGSIMLLLQWKLALLAMATLPLFMLTTLRLGRGIHEAARKQRKREGAMASTAAEGLTAIRELQALSLEESFAEEFASNNARSQKEDLKAARLSAQLGRTVDLLLAVATALILWFGATLVMRGTLTPGDLVVFLFYLKRAFKPAKDFAKYTGRLAKATAAGERVIALLEETADVKDLPGATAAPHLTGHVRLDNVSFRYDDGKPVLSAVDLKIEPGEFVAVTGPSGAGKSTLAGLLMRLHDPVAGRVMIDGHDIREYTLASLRPQVSIVLQSAVLFATTVRENIICGRTDVGEDEVEAAARLANAHDFILELPEGYETRIGERGATLSHGQRQRIAIARAAVRNTPLLILDEPTTGLDEANAREVSAALARLAQGKTTLLITHEPKLVKLAGRVFVIEDRRLRELGHPGESEPARRHGGAH